MEQVRFPLRMRERNWEGGGGEVSFCCCGGESAVQDSVQGENETEADQEDSSLQQNQSREMLLKTLISGV